MLEGIGSIGALPAMSSIQGKEIQTGFVAGMERILQPKVLTKDSQPLESRSDVDAADLQDEHEVDARARDRYQRLFWEPVADNEVRLLSISYF